MSTYSAINGIWVLVATALIFFMQAGFSLLEAGFTRSKNAGNIIMKNIVDFCIAVPIYTFVGYYVMYGGTDRIYETYGIPVHIFMVFQLCFCATSATIVSGAMAERTKFIAYCICSVFITAIIYPVCGRLIWGGGWLESIGFQDFAGGTVVHVVGGMAALIGAKILGPRIGKYAKDGSSKAIPGHNLTIAALGMFILWFGWFGFNGGSIMDISSPKAADLAGTIILNTNICTAISAVATILYTWIRYKKPDVSLTINGAVGGLVASTACCNVIEPICMVFVGVIAGGVVVGMNEWIDKKLHIDDPVGAVGVHLGCGALGSIMIGIFSKTTGLLYGYGFRQLAIQFIGIVYVAVVVAVSMTIVVLLVKKTVGLRVPTKEEIAGLDKIEHGLSNAYEGFMSVNDLADYMPNENATDYRQVPTHAMTQMKTSDNLLNSDAPLTKIEIITKQSKFEELKNELNKIGITGITVSQVLGCGMQKGANEFYRGNAMEIQLLPKIRVEIVVAKVPVKDVVDTAKRVLYTGHVGDGKIFIYHVNNAIKVRTGEEGYDAMQNDD